MVLRYTEAELEGDLVFHSDGLVRTRLTPDGSKMIMSTTGGYLILIHDLDLNNLRQDLTGFQPNIYRLMQKSNQEMQQAIAANHMFRRARNRVELVGDFYENSEMITALEVHPHARCVASRSTTAGSSAEVSDVSSFDDERMACYHFK